VYPYVWPAGLRFSPIGCLASCSVSAWLKSYSLLLYSFCPHALNKITKGVYIMRLQRYTFDRFAQLKGSIASFHIVIQKRCSLVIKLAQSIFFLRCYMNAAYVFLVSCNEGHTSIFPLTKGFFMIDLLSYGIFARSLFLSMGFADKGFTAEY